MAVRTAIALSTALGALMATPLGAQEVTRKDMAALMQRLDRLEAENVRLASELARLKGAQERPTDGPIDVAPNVAAGERPPPSPSPSRVTKASSGVQTAAAEPGDSKEGFSVGVNPRYGFAALDHAEGVNRRMIHQLEARQAGELEDMVTLSGSVTGIAAAHFTNRPNKFGYLMRHPTGNNQRTKSTQELLVHSAQLAFTATPSDAVTVYAEMLYDPEQNFGPGTITAVGRNQLQMRKAWAMLGDLDRSPFYVSVGKMDVPFGLQDTVSPFTNSTNWHAFAPLAFGGQAGYYDGNFSVRAMAIEGGAQFRSANTPVDGTAIPSKLNNFAVDGSYTLDIGTRDALRVGASYIHGSAYCQGYPVTHFSPCAVRNGAWSAYGELDLGRFHFIADFAKTIDAWPGTEVPAMVNPELAEFAASKVMALTVGGRYALPVSSVPTHASFEFSKFKAGADGSPWERQNQFVFGLSHRMAPSVDLFGEVIRTEGWVPLNFLSGGNFPDGSTWSEQDARSHIVVIGMQAGF